MKAIIHVYSTSFSEKRHNISIKLSIFASFYIQKVTSDKWNQLISALHFILNTFQEENLKRFIIPIKMVKIIQKGPHASLNILIEIVFLILFIQFECKIRIMSYSSCFH